MRRCWREVVELLRPGPGRLLLDCTLGGGGHSELFLDAGARMIGLDKDPRAVAAARARLARYGEAFRAVRADFRDELLREVESHDVVLGSRYLDGITVVNWPIERILISWFGNWYARKVAGLRIADTTGGFRCMRRSALEAIRFDRIRADGYAFQIEMNYRFQRIGARVKEIPFFFLDRRRGTSKLTLRIGLEALWIVWWLRLARNGHTAAVPVRERA